MKEFERIVELFIDINFTDPNFWFLLFMYDKVVNLHLLLDPEHMMMPNMFMSLIKPIPISKWVNR